MSCDRYRIMISTDSDGELIGDLKRKLSEHLNGCAECNKLIQFYKNQKKIVSTHKPALNHSNAQVSVWRQVKRKLSHLEKARDKVYRNIYYQLGLAFTMVMILIPEDISKTFAAIVFLYSVLHLYIYGYASKNYYENTAT